MKLFLPNKPAWRKLIKKFLEKSILKEIDGGELKNWRDWKWQVKHSIRDLDTFERLLGITVSDEIREHYKKITAKFPMSITPYYLSLINTEDLENDPIFKQSFPVIDELTVMKTDMVDPLSEDKDSPVPGLTHRYPDRVLFLVSNTCAMYCRHCTRKRKVGTGTVFRIRNRSWPGLTTSKEHQEFETCC